jgi:hypothetical protein
VEQWKAGCLIESRFVLLESDVPPGKLHDDIADPFILWFPNDAICYQGAHVAKITVHRKNVDKRKDAAPIGVITRS